MTYNIENGIYYYFDCLDGLLGEKFLTPAEVSEILTGKPEPLTEKELIRIAADYEATLYRHELTGGQITFTKTLYDCYL